jgi:leader peptidase (prepilin peptidase) / N-methyltransferase
MTIVIALIAGVIGVLAGGVINVLADDLPLRRPVSPPHYPDGAPRSRAAWLGIAAFLTGQRTSPGVPAVPAPVPAGPAAEAQPVADPGVPSEPPAPRLPVRLGWRHPLVEIATGLGFFGLVLGFPHETNLLAWLVYLFIMLLITVIDVEHRLILFVVIIPSCVFALIVAAVSPPQDRAFKEFLVGGLFGFGLFFAMFLGGGVFAMAARHDEVAFGFGDVLLATLSGLMLGWRSFIFAALITVFAGAVGAILYIGGRALMRRRYRWFTPLPYGPYIVIGTLVMLFFREDVAHLLKASVY